MRLHPDSKLEFCMQIARPEWRPSNNLFRKAVQCLRAGAGHAIIEAMEPFESLDCGADLDDLHARREPISSRAMRLAPINNSRIQQARDFDRWLISA